MKLKQAIKEVIEAIKEVIEAIVGEMEKAPVATFFFLSVIVANLVLYLTS